MEDARGAADVMENVRAMSAEGGMSAILKVFRRTSAAASAAANLHQRHLFHLNLFCTKPVILVRPIDPNPNIQGE